MGSRRLDLLDLARIGGRIGRKARPVDRDIAGSLRPDLRSTLLDCRAQVDHGGTRVVIDGNPFGCVLGRIERVRDRHGDGLTHMAHGLAGEGGPVRNDELAAAAPRERRMLRYVADAFEVSGGEHGVDAAHLPRGSRVDGTDIGEGMGRAHEGGVELARHWRVGGIAANPAQ
jgi:hypothetical protein